MAFHDYDISELYSNADGSLQFIELSIGGINGEDLWQGQSITVTQGGTSHSYMFLSNLPSFQTANTKVLIATQGFANLGIVTPDYIIPSGFLFTSGGATVNFAGVDAVAYTTLPTDGTTSLNRSGGSLTAGVNSPTNFAGATGTVQVPSNVITGTDGADNLVGTAADETISGAAGNDLLTGGGGNDSLDGGANVDTSLYSGPRANYTVTKTASGYSVTGPEGNDTLTAVERLQFADGKFAIDLGPGEAANNTVRVIGAAFGAGSINPLFVGIGLQIFDAGVTLSAVCQQVAQIMGLNNTDFVREVYENVVGVPPDATSLALFVGLLQTGAATQGQLLELAASLDLTAQSINLVGLQQSGVEFV